MRGNDTYTNFVKGNSGVDQIADSRGKDKLLLTNCSQFGWTLKDTVLPTLSASSTAPSISSMKGHHSRIALREVMAS